LRETAEGDEKFEGYMGNDTFKIKDQKLVRIFPSTTRTIPMGTRPAREENWFMAYIRERPCGN